MTACRNCTEAKAQAWHGFTHDCDGCRARALSRGPDYHQSRVEKRQTAAYRAALVKLGVTHEQVKAAAAIDVMNKGAVLPPSEAR